MRDGNENNWGRKGGPTASSPPECEVTSLKQAQDELSPVLRQFQQEA